MTRIALILALMLVSGIACANIIGAFVAGGGTACSGTPPFNNSGTGPFTTNAAPVISLGC